MLVVRFSWLIILCSETCSISFRYLRFIFRISPATSFKVSYANILAADHELTPHPASNQNMCIYLFYPQSSAYTTKSFPKKSTSDYWILIWQLLRVRMLYIFNAGLQKHLKCAANKSAELVNTTFAYLGPYLQVRTFRQYRMFRNLLFSGQDNKLCHNFEMRP